MTAAINKIFWENSRRYGSRRVREALKKQGIKAGRHRVRRLMQAQDWRAIQPRSFVPKTTNSNHGLTACPNRLIEFGKRTAPNQVWVGDITYLPLSNGEWFHLASLMEWPATAAIFTPYCGLAGWQGDERSPSYQSFRPSH